MSQARAPMSSRDTTLRRYIDRHSGFVIGVSMFFAVVSCFGLVMLFGLYSSFGGDNGIVITLGLCLWLVFNGWAIRRFVASLRRRASSENECQRYDRLKPLQQTG